MKSYTIPRYTQTEFGEWIVTRLLKYEMTLKDFNDKIGYGYLTTRNFMTGEIDPSFHYLVAVATLFSKLESRPRPDVMCEIIRLLVK